MKKNKYKLAVGIATNGEIKTKTVFSLLQLQKKTPFNIIIWESCLVHQNREKIAKAMLKSDCTHLLFIDADMIFPEDAAEILIKRDKDIIGVHSNVRGETNPTTTIKIHDENGNDVSKKQPDGTVECFGVGTGFMLIKRKVFEKLSHPWFSYEYDDEGISIRGEDMYFCKIAREAGFKVFFDPTIRIGHIGTYIY